MSTHGTGGGNFAPGTTGISVNVGSGGVTLTRSTASTSPVGSVDIKTHAVTQSDVASMDANQIMEILHNLPVEDVVNAAQAHLDLGKKLDDVASRLRSHASTLHQGWQGTAAQAAMGKFQEMHDQTALLAAQATQTGQVLQWVGSEVLPEFKKLPTPQATSTMAHDQQAGANLLSGGGTAGKAIGAAGGTVVGGVMDAIGLGSNGQAQANEQAQKYLTSLNSHLIAANNAMPSPIGQSLISSNNIPPASGSSAGGGASGTGAPYGVAGAPAVHGAGSAPAAAGASAGGASAGGGPAAHKFSSAGLTQRGDGSTANLQSVVTTTSGPTTPPPGPTGPAPGPGPAGPVPTFVPTSGPSGPGPDENLAAEDLTARDTPPGDAVTGEDVAGVDGATSDGVIGEEMPGMMAPGMGGAAGGAPAEDLAADDYALREVNPDLAANGAASGAVLGDEVAPQAAVPMMGGSGSSEEEKERRRQAWMNEDADIWGRPADNIPSVIEAGS